MRFIKLTLLIVFLFVIVAAQSLEPPLSDSRLTLHTLVREDIFAGFLANDLERLARGEKNIKLLLEQRPTQKASLLAWQGGATLYRAVRALENNRSEEFKQLYQQALDNFAQAQQLEPQNDGVAAVTGGSLVLFADRLPQEHRAAAWAKTYEAYSLIWKRQAPVIERLPLHLKGELLGGLAQSAQRTGRTEELAQYLTKIQEVLRDTPYERVAKQWQSAPETAAKTTITCLSCHESGRLSARISALNK